MSEKINHDFRIEKDDLDSRLGYETQIPKGYVVVPLRKVVQARRIIPLEIREMEAHIKHIPLIASRDIFPYANSKIMPQTVTPQALHVAQTFVLQSKLISIMQGLDSLYTSLCFPGLGRRTVHYLLGEDLDGNQVCGTYFPPLVEILNGEGNQLLFDGSHRTAICGKVGRTTESITIKGSSVDPPYEGVPWSVNIVNEKPPIEKRYVNFNRSLLKDFGHVGIDG